MTRSPTVLTASLCEIVGLFLLAREVYLGHKMEQITRGFESAKLLQLLYAREDFEGFYIASRLDQGDTPERAREWIRTLGPEAIRNAVEDQWSQTAAGLAASIKRWEEETTPAAMRNRRWALVVGTLLLMVAAGLHLIE